MVKLRAPKNFGSMSVEGRQVEVVKGVASVDPRDVATLLSHGFLPVETDPSSIEGRTGMVRLFADNARGFAEMQPDAALLAFAALPPDDQAAAFAAVLGMAAPKAPASE